MSYLHVHPEVAAALAEGRPVVALESTIISHGLPRPDNLRIAREIEQRVRDAGAVPATIAVVAGRVRIGLDDAGLETVATDPGVTKVSVRDLGTLLALGGHGSTTVASTSYLAARAGIGVFATGGLGGVHRQARESWDESADLATLAATPVTVVCSGVKSILDVPATLERMETLNIPVVGYRTDRFPGFYLTDSGQPLRWRLEDPAQIAAAALARCGLGLGGGLVVANPLPVADQLDPELHDRVLAAGLAELAEQGVSGKDVTPFLLGFFHRQTGGASLRANVKLVARNAELAGRIAVATAEATADRP